MTLTAFREIVYIDFEFRAGSGERPSPICYVAIEQRSGRAFKRWLDDGKLPAKPPFAHGADVLHIAYFASAEWGCYLKLGWKLPEHVLDLYAEFRNLTNGRSVPCGKGLLGALQYFGLDSIEGAKKDFIRQRVLAGDPYSAEERATILDYCASDVRALHQLLPRMFGAESDVRAALLRGRYTKAIAHSEHNGIPVDAPLYTEFAGRWPELQQRIIDRVNVPVFDGRTFRAAKFAEWAKSQNFQWPVLLSGALALDDDTFREMAARYPAVEPLRQVRQMLGQLRKPDLAVGSDGRNRVLLSPFGTITGRNTPSNSRFIFGLPSWMRGLIRPEPGRALAYIDWSQQEFGIAAALSGDVAMQRAYHSGDPYLEFAKLAGAVGGDATKESNPVERRLFKTTLLGVQYQLGSAGLAYQLGVGPPEAETLLEHHRRIFPQFWRWSDAACDAAQLQGQLSSVFGWILRFATGTKLRTIRNFPMQANGSEMLRLACSFATEAGVLLVAPVHDALLIESADADIDAVVAQTQEAMRRASEIVLAGFALRSDVQVIRHPNRFRDERGERCGAGYSKHFRPLLIVLLLYIRDPPPVSKSEWGLPMGTYPPYPSQKKQRTQRPVARPIIATRLLSTAHPSAMRLRASHAQRGHPTPNDLSRAASVGGRPPAPTWNLSTPEPRKRGARCPSSGPRAVLELVPSIVFGRLFVKC